LLHPSGVRGCVRPLDRGRCPRLFHASPSGSKADGLRLACVAAEKRGWVWVGGWYTAPMKSKATTVKEYLASLPEDRRAGIEAVRKVILKNLDKDYEESMLWGMIGYAVPHRVWPLGYHCDPKKPLMMAALSSQKNNMTVYLMPFYSEKTEREWFQKAWAKSVEGGMGKKLHMGGCCIHFKTLEDAALDVIGEAVRRTPAKAYVENYVKMLASTGRGPDGKKLKGEKVAKKTAKKSAKKVAKKKAKG
jgi:hypothetical protein